MSILCRLGFHNWLYRSVWEPSFDAMIITGFKEIRICRRCDRREVVADDSFDPATGEPIEADAP